MSTTASTTASAAHIEAEPFGEHGIRIYWCHETDRGGAQTVIDVDNIDAMWRAVEEADARRQDARQMTINMEAFR